ncbi:hypothetical protein CXG81DRAFT_15554 [Caulochytrium protostelioides]|uniref:Prefoldin subunit 3 n=1 Tax=Caulochytrium protostelioides TaxID=1555241 RepID=A0A4P9X1T2_9FUNG|nr:Prefoldin, subunit 3 [Caulochytrium protostelioides]RKO98707.1 hypothetical protein CXG81DRAFT_15554 [Caulochytrium protostelioides]|eukprot:RKO98707.1 hypothetical protein CXG81DRAFT_15554 [Caulochytrium protostelioides]
MPKIEANPRGIPKAPFVEKVEEFCAIGEADATLRSFQEMIAKYKYMQTSLEGRKKSLESKLPEITKTLELVQFMNAKSQAATDQGASPEPLNTHYELSDTLWANAKVDLTDKVNLWLGANVMLEYSLEEAEALLTTKRDAARTTLKQVDEDLEYLREQITTMEVNTARVYNWDVKNRRQTAPTKA